MFFPAATVITRRQGFAPVADSTTGINNLYPKSVEKSNILEIVNGQVECRHSQTLCSCAPAEQNVILETEFFLENSVSVTG